MIVTILTMGSRGDVYPYIALGQGLKRAEFDVRLATLQPFESAVRTNGLNFIPVSDPVSALKESTAWRDWQSAKVGPWRRLRALRRVVQEAQPDFVRCFEECYQACCGSDFVVSSLTGFVGPSAAERLNVPHLWALLQPSTPTRTFSHFMSPFALDTSPILNRLTYSVADKAFTLIFGSALVCFRRQLGLQEKRKLCFPGSGGDPVIYGFSPSVVPQPTDWPAAGVHVTGYWHFDDTTPWAPPDSLAKFLARGDDAVCICHASITGWRSHHESLEIISTAVRKAGLRAVAVCSTERGAAQLSDTLFVIDSLPFDWLFRRVGLVVHHGGAGTTAAALTHGRPSVVLPACFDQHFWARTLCRLGAAPRPLNPHTLTADSLAAVLRDTIASPSFRRAAARCKADLCGEHGVDTAVALIRSHLVHNQRS